MTRLTIVLLVAGLLALLACGHGSGGDPLVQDRGSARILLGKNEVPGFDSLVIKVSGTGMADMHFSYSQYLDQCVIDDIPPGADRRFTVHVYATGGVLVQQGESVTDILSGEKPNLTIVLQALVGFIRIEVPLGLINTQGIVSGALQVQIEGEPQQIFAMVMGQGKGTFTTSALPLQNTLQLKINLQDALGGILYTGERTVILANLVQNEELTLHSTQGGVNMTIQLASSEPVQILASLPSTYSRIPRAANELIFTEIFANPKTSGDEFEYLEIYNTTLDTLTLNGCVIGRARTSTGNTSLLTLANDIRITPMSYLVLGRDSVQFANAHYQNFVLSNSGQSLVLFCGNTVLDSLTFLPSNDPVNPFPIAQGASMHLPLSKWQTRQQGSSWCAATQSVTAGSLTLKGSPSLDAICP